MNHRVEIDFGQPPLNLNKKAARDKIKEFFIQHRNLVL